MDMNGVQEGLNQASNIVKQLDMVSQVKVIIQS